MYERLRPFLPYGLYGSGTVHRNLSDAYLSAVRGNYPYDVPLFEFPLY